MGIFGNLFKVQPQTAEESKNLNKMVERLKQYGGEGTHKWLNLMRDTSPLPAPGPAPTIEDVDRPEVDEFDEGIYVPSDQTLSVTEPPQVQNLDTATGVESELRKWVNRLFADFAGQVASFNSSPCGKDRAITVHAPEFAGLQEKSDDCNVQKQTTVFKAYLATEQWGMLFQGSSDRMEIYLVPAAVILDFSLQGSLAADYTPLMTIDTSAVELEKVWRIDGAAIRFDALPQLTENLFSRLLNVATDSSSRSESELFPPNQDRSKLEETIAQCDSIQSKPRIVFDATPSSLPTARASLNPSIERMRTWTVSSQLLKAIDDDMPWLTELKGDIDSKNQAADSARLEDLIKQLRIVSGQIGGLVATYHPPAGSKYNAS